MFLSTKALFVVIKTCLGQNILLKITTVIQCIPQCFL